MDEFISFIIGVGIGVVVTFFPQQCATTNDILKQYCQSHNMEYSEVNYIHYCIGDGKSIKIGWMVEK